MKQPYLTSWSRISYWHAILINFRYPVYVPHSLRKSTRCQCTECKQKLCRHESIWKWSYASINWYIIQYHRVLIVSCVRLRSLLIHEKFYGLRPLNQTDSRKMNIWAEFLTGTNNPGRAAKVCPVLSLTDRLVCSQPPAMGGQRRPGELPIPQILCLSAPSRNFHDYWPFPPGAHSASPHWPPSLSFS